MFAYSIATPFGKADANFCAALLEKAAREGTATPYAVFHLQERGIIFIPPGARVYEVMIVGEYSRDNNLNVNICREKKLTNIRAAGRDENIIITPHREMGCKKESNGSRTMSWLKYRRNLSGYGRRF